ncbi:MULTISPECIES: FtsB family cell division protein [Tissierellales]|jgi:cell division protein FtsB|uniref:Septum formation initiator family protein n=1 Tax=Acidilutibacter cellobiosedens TaxID=2507161 RepID=A0A410QFI6_9FIRM|nr:MULTISPECIES: septum formation initiator family protein [Tissierellales]MBE6082233.1 septum formation initiator family protein [Tissierellaceae bacterium]QAT62760.1 septum formation initiator family protein [Acidilutibacter cellobiosedens]SCL95422.1 Septum formation initiator [Sporanaerobacter sp. PP17-6a]
MKKNKRIKIRHLFILFFALYIGSAIISQQKMFKNLSQEKAQKVQEVKEIKKQINEIDKEIDQSNTLEFVEKTAREDLNMVKPREIMYVDLNKSNNAFLKGRK